MPEPTNRAPQPEPQPEPNEKLVKIFDTEQENEALVVKGLLESAGIDSDLKSIDAVQDAFPGVGGTVLLVREEDAPEAGKIIEAYRQMPPLDEETADIDISGVRGESS
jgi:Putative prokaryotic signal transducing protein